MELYLFAPLCFHGVETNNSAFYSRVADEGSGEVRMAGVDCWARGALRRDQYYSHLSTASTDLLAVQKRRHEWNRKIGLVCPLSQASDNWQCVSVMIIIGAFASKLKFAPLTLPCLSVLTYKVFIQSDDDADFTTVCLWMPVLINIEQERSLHMKT